MEVNRFRRAALLGLLVLGRLAAAFAADAIDPRFVAKADSPSGLKWIAGDRGSPFMRPGESCIACHAAKGGPKYLVAGTVYTKADEPDDVLGVAGAVVQLWDSAGKSYKLAANQAGNFMLPAKGVTFPPPYKVSVYLDNKERKMLAPARTGDCAQCHTAKGTGGAPGRVMAP